ncbi:TPA: hypothetical protein LEL88_003582 [Vibrio cholerae]|uniref:Uncharacterized protein n=1 Tax=Vibrio cholerae TaxID=666 RepID=A0A7X3EXF1_VIBCL|nr:hypothetical protein EEL44_00970 [Vibrio cholerae]KAA6185343.1 hypothetical protein F2S06_18810 [Vibrio cholerae O1 biovar El Tor]MBU5845191.1 hypothetical protein [Vibrio cholerae O1]QGF30643.1 hypothetical protein GG844_04490 [Vibrio cholerae O395]QJS94704.1 hypothetical protein GTF72_15645 [Vibrio cholerae C6706]QNE73095.1 hypothetical protein H6M50_17180 [Vibrio cholerae MO10]HDB3933274.1 hypothetical protein [Vibrio cholerae O1 biovar El Tor str. Inaba RND18826]
MALDVCLLDSFA